MVLLKRNLYGHPFAGSVLGRQFEDVLLEHGWDKVPNWECLFVDRKQGLFVSENVDDTHMAGRKQKMSPMWKTLTKLVDLDEPTSFLDHVHVGCTQRECNPNGTIVDEYRKCSNLEFLLQQLKNYQDGKSFTQRRVRGLTTWKDTRRNALKDVVSCQKKNTEQLYKVSTSCLDDHHFKKEELESVGDLSKVCSQIVLKCLCLARIGRFDNLWSVNEVARAVVKWTRACDRRLVRFIPYSHHTYDYRQYCHVGNMAQHCRLGLFQDSDFVGEIEESKPTSGGILCIFGSRTFVPISWMCKKQTAVSHSSKESEVISLDAGLRMDGLLALDLWDMVIEVLHFSNNAKSSTQGQRETACEIPTPS